MAAPSPPDQPHGEAPGPAEPTTSSPKQQGFVVDERTRLDARAFRRPEVSGTVPVREQHRNVDQVLITTTEDRAQLVLERQLRLANARTAWTGPAGVVLAIVTTFLTADFKGFIVSAATWQAVFMVVLAFALWKLLIAGLRAFQAPRFDDAIRKAIEELKRRPTESGATSHAVPTAERGHDPPPGDAAGCRR